MPAVFHCERHTARLLANWFTLTLRSGDIHRQTHTQAQIWHPAACSHNQLQAKALRENQSICATKTARKRHKSNHYSPKKLPFQCIWTAFKPRNDGSYCCKRRHFTQQDTAFHPAIYGKTRYRMASTTLSQTYSATFSRQKRNRQTSWEPPFTLAICHHDDEVTIREFGIRNNFTNREEPAFSFAPSGRLVTVIPRRSAEWQLPTDSLKLDDCRCVLYRTHVNNRKHINQFWANVLRFSKF